MMEYKNKICVFAGPSRSSQDCDTVIHWRPPASRGDIHDAVADGFKTIVLADTLFFDAAPPHSELLDCLKEKILLVGCSSAGALRAAELRNHGMRGCGLVYTIFKEKLLNDDGELAAVLDHSYTSIAPTLLELRCILGRFVEQGGRWDLAEDAFTKLKCIYFMRRTRPVIETIMRNSLGSTEEATTAISLLSDDRFKIKRNDLRSTIDAFAQNDKIRTILPRHSQRVVIPKYLELGLTFGRR